MTYDIPHHVDSELALLGGLLVWGAQEDFDNVSDLLKPDGSDFYKTSHRVLYATIASEFTMRQAVDVVTLTERLRADGNLKRVGGAADVAAISNLSPTASTVRYYAERIKTASVQRAVIATARDIELEAGAKPCGARRGWRAFRAARSTSPRV